MCYFDQTAHIGIWHLFAKKSGSFPSIVDLGQDPFIGSEKQEGSWLVL